MAEPAEPTLGRVLVGLIPMMLALVSLNAAMLIVAPLWGGIARELGYSEVLAGVITSATPALWMLTAPGVPALICGSPDRNSKKLSEQRTPSSIAAVSRHCMS